MKLNKQHFWLLVIQKYIYDCNPQLLILFFFFLIWIGFQATANVIFRNGSLLLVKFRPSINISCSLYFCLSYSHYYKHLGGVTSSTCRWSEEVCTEQGVLQSCWEEISSDILCKMFLSFNSCCLIPLSIHIKNMERTLTKVICFALRQMSYLCNL